MNKVLEIFKERAITAPLSRDVTVSFEFFPPKTEKMEQTLWDSVQRLAPVAPAFVSVTYGAGGYAYAADLVAGLKKIADFEITVAAYPETHPEAASPAADLDNLKHKIDAGAGRAITQFFFDADAYLGFVIRARAAGITVPIEPGLLPATNYKRVVEFSAACGASLPPWMGELFEGLDDDPETRRLVAATVAAEQCRALHAAGVRHFHFYTLNRADLVYAICHILGVRPEEGAGNPA